MSQSITMLMQQRAALAKCWEMAMPDEECGKLCAAQVAIDNEILTSPAESAQDLAAKFALWLELVEDPACILKDRHPALLLGLWRDVARLTGIAEGTGAMAA